MFSFTLRLLRILKKVPVQRQSYLLSGFEGVWGSGGIANSFLISALGGGEWCAPHSGRFALWKKSVKS
jgi:hypothetical protein